MAVARADCLLLFLLAILQTIQLGRSVTKLQWLTPEANLNDQGYSPHPDCSIGRPNNSDVSSDVTTYCPVLDDGGYIIPGNFDVAVLHPQLHRLTISGGTVAPSFVPLPFRSRLQELSVDSFNLAPTDYRFPLGRFVGQNDRNIKSLYLNNVKLEYISVQDLATFGQLRSLILISCQIDSISSYVFQQLGEAPKPMPLELLLISKNPLIGGVEWNFLEPVSQTLQHLELSDSKLTSDMITMYSAFTLNNMTSILLPGNKLTSLPVTVFSTFNPSLKLHVSLRHGTTARNPHDSCPQSFDCQCCDNRPFAQWMRRYNSPSAKKTLDCGTDPRMMYSSSSLMSKRSVTRDDQRRMCREPESTTSLGPVLTTVGISDF